MANSIFTVKDFINDFWISQVGNFYEHNDFASFYLIGVGIEFLGRCLDDPNLWDNGEGRSRDRFHKAINEISSLAKYKPYLQTNNYLYISAKVKALAEEIERLKTRSPSLHDIDDVSSKLTDCMNMVSTGGSDFDLYSTLRCGLVHEGLPKVGLALANGYEAQHLQVLPDGLILDVKSLSSDFVAACNEIISETGRNSNVRKNLARQFIKIHSKHRTGVTAGGVETVPIATGNQATCPLGKTCVPNIPTYETSFDQDWGIQSLTAAKPEY